jgi:hypothetical protein
MGPDQIAEVEDVQPALQGEAHHEVLAVVEGQDAAGGRFTFMGLSICPSRGGRK